MGYTSFDKTRAFKIYYENGSLSETVKILKTISGFQKISKSTVSAWALEKNTSGENWYERRSKIEQAQRDAVDETLARDRRTILTEAQAFKNRLYSQLPQLEAKTLEGGVNAFQSISNFILKQSGEDRSSEETAQEAVQALLLALRSDKDISALLDKKWKSIEKEFFTNLEKIKKGKK